ncbi:hypothetical protein KAK10_06165 [Periweissella beninensis]|uniref:Uncharacterized protein n=1 Tax=Periweissella beninensis TaxID=504936 RepID=A0ABT0VI39_9LACO|nr:hypothetical protein [Periweissella beninensis]
MGNSITKIANKVNEFPKLWLSLRQTTYAFHNNSNWYAKNNITIKLKTEINGIHKNFVINGFLTLRISQYKYPKLPANNPKKTKAKN